MKYTSIDDVKAFDAKAAMERLQTDPRMDDVNNYLKQQLSRRGIDNIENAIKRFFYRLVEIPGKWCLSQDETTEGREVRLKKIAALFDKLADLVEQDRDAQRLRVFDEKSLFEDGLAYMPSKPLVSDYLRDIGYHLENIQPNLEKLLIERVKKPKKGKNDSTMAVQKNLILFAQEHVFFLLDQIRQNHTEKSPNKHVATLITILLDLPKNQEPNPNTFSQRREEKRFETNPEF